MEYECTMATAALRNTLFELAQLKEVGTIHVEALRGLKNLQQACDNEEDFNRLFSERTDVVIETIFMGALNNVIGKIRVEKHKEKFPGVEW